MTRSGDVKKERRWKTINGDRNARRIDIILRLFSGIGAAVVTIAVAAILLDCEFERVIIVGFNPAWCSPTVRIAAAVSVSAGVGFLAFLILEGSGMILASMWLEKERKAAEERRREEAERNERRIAAAERMAEAAERRADAAERLRREEAERAERLRREEAERAERREERLLALLERRNGGSAQRDADDEDDAAG